MPDTPPTVNELLTKHYGLVTLHRSLSNLFAQVLHQYANAKDKASTQQSLLQINLDVYFSNIQQWNAILLQLQVEQPGLKVEEIRYPTGSNELYSAARTGNLAPMEHQNLQIQSELSNQLMMMENRGQRLTELEAQFEDLNDQLEDLQEDFSHLIRNTPGA